MWLSPCCESGRVKDVFWKVLVGIVSPNTIGNMSVSVFKVRGESDDAFHICDTVLQPGQLTFILEDACMLLSPDNLWGWKDIRIVFNGKQDQVKECSYILSWFPQNVYRDTLQYRMNLPSGKCWVYSRGSMRPGDPVADSEIVEYASRYDWHKEFQRKREWQGAISGELMTRCWHPSRIKYWAHEDPELLQLLSIETSCET